MFWKAWVCGMLWLGAAAMVSAQDRPEMAASPSWVAAEPIATGKDANSAGGDLRYELVSDQIDLTGTKPVWHRHIGFTVLREQGLTDGGNFSIGYQPDYQSLVLNQLDVLRDGQRIDMRDRAHYARLRRERDLDSALLDGEVTLNVTVPDLRVGDRLDYSYSVIGQNPIFGTAYYDRYGARYAVPVGWRRVRVRFPQDKPVLAQVSVKGFETARSVVDGVETLDVTARDLAAVREPDDTPDGYDSFGTISLSTARNWAEVIAWGAPLYPHAFTDKAVAAAMTRQLQLDPAQPEASLLRAVAFVQGEIRYTGLDMGANSHAPHAPEATLADRFGDCKDKATLLVALLQLAGVRAEPVLVNTQPGTELRQMQPGANVFDHVVVRAHLGGREVWIDATRDREFGPLAERLALPYRTGLPLVAGADRLVDIPYPVPSLPQVEVTEQVQVHGTAEGYTATFDVATHYRQDEGGSVSANFRRDGAEATGRRYLKYMRDFYAGLKAVGLPKMQDPGEGVLDMHERYRLDWKRNDGSVIDVWLFQLNDWMAELPDDERDTPRALGGPRFARQQVTVKADTGFSIPDERTVVENPWFRFVRTVHVEDRTLHITGEWRRLARQVPADGTAQAARDMVEARDLLAFSLDLSPAATLWGAVGWRDWIWPLAGLLLAALLVLACIPFRRGSLPMATLFAPRHAALAVPAQPWSMRAAWLAFFCVMYFDMAAERLSPSAKIPMPAMALILVFAAPIGGWLRVAIFAGLMRVLLRWLKCPAATFEGLAKAVVVGSFPMLPFMLAALVALQGHITWLQKEFDPASTHLPGIVMAGILLACGYGWSFVATINAMAVSAATSRRRALAALAILMMMALLLVGVGLALARLARG